jgi:pilus assembly protein Flp/PilA
MRDQIIRFLRDEQGMTTVEYAVAASLVTVAVVAAFNALGGAVGSTLTSLTNAISGTP